jgi:ribosomal protein L39E
MENNQLYNIFSEDGEVEKSNLSVSEVIDYANACFYYEMLDYGEEDITSIQDAINLFETNGQEVVAIHKYGGTMAKENYQMVANQNRQIGHHTNELKSALKGNKDVPAWVVAKVNRSATDLSDATHYLEGEIMALGGNIDVYGANEFFNGLNLSEVPSDISDYIQDAIITDKDLELISNDDETFVEVKNLIAKKYPKSLEDSQELKSEETPMEESESIKKYMLEISDLKELVDIEDDADLIAKYNQEISDLQELIDIEKI